MKNTSIIFVLVSNLFISINGYAAVTSVGEINVADQTEGLVRASTTAALIMTLVIDKSLAESGEEIKTIEILMPPGFRTQSSYFKGISRDRNPLAARAVVSGGDVLRVELADLIVDLQNSIYEITFDCLTPITITLSAAFRARLRNLYDAPIGEFIREGQADGKLNNDDFTLQVIANVPPGPVTGFTAEADTTGENDVTLRWQNSADPDVNGYLIYSVKETPINVKGRLSTTFRDVNVPPGEHTYQITAYKTILLQSERSPIQTVKVSTDTAAPEPPMALRITTSNEGVEVSWKPSISRDVTEYRILFGSAETDGFEPLGVFQRTPGDEVNGYRFIDERILSIGSFTYAIIAVDESDNASIPTTTTPTAMENTTVSLLPISVQSPNIGQLLKLSVKIANGKNVAGYQATVQFDDTALRYVESSNSDYLPDGAFFVSPILEGNLVRLNAASLAGESNGDGTLVTITFEVIAVKASILTLSDVLLSNSTGETFAPQVENTQITEPTKLAGDVNSDGTVNIADLVLVASNLGQIGQNAADVNSDGVVNIADLVLVAGALGEGPAAAPTLHASDLEGLTAAEVQDMLTQARQMALTDPAYLRGIAVLEQLQALLLPKETALLPNYPNPFNPETWIPYQLAKPAEVTLHIYSVNGTLVRVLALGHQSAGQYQSRSRTAYWDGKNAFGEPVASGLYFYTLTAGDFTATRKMLIAK